MTTTIDIPGGPSLELSQVVLDVNGTLTRRGEPIPGVVERLAALRGRYEVHLLSADTFGTLASVAAELGVAARRVGSGEDKRRVVEELGAGRCAAVGNGAIDAAMLEAAALGIAVVGPEGAAGEALRVADVVCGSIHDALDLLLDEQALLATLRR